MSNSTDQILHIMNTLADLTERVAQHMELRNRVFDAQSKELDSLDERVARLEGKDGKCD